MRTVHERHGGRNHGQAIAYGCVVGTDQAMSSGRASKAQRRTTARARSGLPHRHPVRAQERRSLGIPAPRNGLRIRDDLLASSAGLAGSRRVADDLAGVAGRIGTCRRNRLVYFRDGQLFGSRAFWGAKTGPNPTDRGKSGSKRHLIVEANGIPLAIQHSGANVHDSEMAIALVDAIPSIKQPRGGPRKRPDEVLADRAYDAEDKIRKPLRRRGIKPLIGKRNTEHGSGLGKYRYVVEAAFDWLFNQRRLRVRYEKRDDIHEAFLIAGCFLICWRRIRQIKGFC